MRLARHAGQEVAERPFRRAEAHGALDSLRRGEQQRGAERAERRPAPEDQRRERDEAPPVASYRPGTSCNSMVRYAPASPANTPPRITLR